MTRCPPLPTTRPCAEAWCGGPIVRGCGTTFVWRVARFGEAQLLAAGWESLAGEPQLVRDWYIFGDRVFRHTRRVADGTALVPPWMHAAGGAYRHAAHGVSDGTARRAARGTALALIDLCTGCPHTVALVESVYALGGHAGVWGLARALCGEGVATP